MLASRSLNTTASTNRPPPTHALMLKSKCNVVPAATPRPFSFPVTALPKAVSEGMPAVHSAGPQRTSDQYGRHAKGQNCVRTVESAGR